MYQAQPVPHLVPTVSGVREQQKECSIHRPLFIDTQRGGRLTVHCILPP